MNRSEKMNYNFDEVIERRGTDAYKYVGLQDVCGRTDVQPMWIADMDFATPPFVIEALRKRVGQGVLGYTGSGDKYRQSISDWCQSHYGWNVGTEQITYVPGVVAGIFLAVHTFTEKGDSILIQEPVYHPFRIVPQGSGRKVVWNHLTRTADSFNMDLDAFRRDIRGCSMMILCNPHNPAGICWDRETLKEVAHICASEGVLVVSDEIHCDMLLGSRTHIPFASVSEEASSITITLQAPSKVFNMPGVVTAHTIVTDPALRERYFSYIENSDMDLGNVFCYDCTVACYSDRGDEWRHQMLDYVQGNIDYLTDALASFTDLVRPVRPQASFLVFMDCTRLMECLAAGKPAQEAQDALTRFFADRCGICMNPGLMFGPGGLGFMRLNVGCPRREVEAAVSGIRRGLETLNV